MIRISRRQFTAVFVLISLLTLASGFCFGTFALASTMPMSMAGVSSPGMDSTHCGGDTVSFEKGSPLSNSVMPCCVDRHDGQATAIPTIIKDKIRFSQVVVFQPVTENNLALDSKTYLSSSSPPPEPDILASVIKNE